jgi:hypothetical protein
MNHVQLIDFDATCCWFEQSGTELQQQLLSATFQSG